MEKIKKILKDEKPMELLALFNFSISESNEQILLKFNCWARYFFPNYFESEDADFHEEINLGNLEVYKGIILDSFVDAAFRGAGKDVKTQLFIVYVILNDVDHFRKYFKCLSDDNMNSEQSVTDIYNMLVNPRVAKLYPGVFEKSVFKREERMSSFTTKDGIKVIADTVGTAQRGAKAEEARPDFIWYNDFETRITLRSAVKTNAIWQNMEEARTGLQKGGGCVYTCNYLSEQGNVHKLITTKLSDRKRVLIVPIIKDGIPTWDRYTVENIEEMKRTDDDFDGERLCKPNSSKDVYFDRERLDNMPSREPIKTVGEFKMFYQYDPSHRYASGHDVAGGVGRDSSTSVFIDFDTIPARVVGTFASNMIAPEAFGIEVYDESNRFGGNLVAIENNKFDQAILKAKQLGADLYKTQGKIIKIGYTPPVTYGWNTNSLTKSKMLSSLRTAVNDGLLELNDPALIAEAKNYTLNDLIDGEQDIRLTTRHFDLLMACGMAWQMKDFAKAKGTTKRHDPVWNKKEEINPAM